MHGAALLLAVAGCGRELTREQQVLLTSAESSFERAWYDAAINDASRFLAQVDSRPEMARALYVRGMSYAQNGKRDQAYTDLQNATRVPGDEDTVWRAYVVLGTLSFEEQRWERAGEFLRAAAQRMPAAPPKDTVLWRLGVCYERTGQWSAARTTQAQLAREFPASPHAPSVQRRKALQPSHFSVQCGVFNGEANAERLKALLLGHGLPAFIEPEPYDRGRRYVVLVGRFGTREEAELELGRVRQHVRDAILWP